MYLYTLHRTLFHREMSMRLTELAIMRDVIKVVEVVYPSWKLLMMKLKVLLKEHMINECIKICRNNWIRLLHRSA